MLTLRNLFKTFTILVLCLSTWLCIRLVGFLLSEYPNENTHFVPKNAHYAIRIDGRNLGEDVLFTVLMASRDEEVIDLLKQKRKDFQGKKTSLSGVNPLSDIILFEIIENKNVYYGVLFNLYNAELFLKEMPEKYGKDFAFSANSKVGLLLIASSGSRKELRSIAQNYFKKKNNFGHHFFDKKHDKKHLAEVHLHDGSTKNEHEIELRFDNEQGKLKVEGTYSTHSKIEPSSSAYLLVPEGIHLTNLALPGHWADSAKALLQQVVKTPLPPIKSVSLNYRGMDIINHPSGYFPLPDLDLVLEVKDSFNVQNFVENYVAQSKFECLVTDNFIEIEGMRMYFQQLNENTFYFGRTQSPNFIKSDGKTLLLIKGNLNPINSIRGGGFLTSMLSISPTYQASKTLTNRTSEVNVQVTKQGDMTAKIEGELVFKEDYFALNELLRFLLISSN